MMTIAKKFRSSLTEEGAGNSGIQQIYLSNIAGSGNSDDE
jgi:hypothetical protein